AQQDAGTMADLEDVDTGQGLHEPGDLALLGPVEHSHQLSAEDAEPTGRQRREGVRHRAGAPCGWCRWRGRSHIPHRGRPTPVTRPLRVTDEKAYPPVGLGSGRTRRTT